jgi:hypothetical protein
MRRISRSPHPLIYPLGHTHIPGGLSCLNCLHPLLDGHSFPSRPRPWAPPPLAPLSPMGRPQRRRPNPLSLGRSARASAPFRIHEPRAKLLDLRRRILATQFPEQEPVPDRSQGVQLATMQSLADYWANHYNWRKCEARFNSFPNFLTEIDGLDITSFMSAPSTRTPFHSSSVMAGPAPSSSR